MGCWKNTRKACKSLAFGSWITSFSRVLPTSCVGYHAGKPTESVIYYFDKITLSFLWVYWHKKPYVFNQSERTYHLSYFINSNNYKHLIFNSCRDSESSLWQTADISIYTAWLKNVFPILVIFAARCIINGFTHEKMGSFYINSDHLCEFPNLRS